ncbi:MAG: aminotransferase class IV [Bacteroidetes bacterium]|nr:aminotransferase class IV [Bacteroidota bacterium]
MSLLLETIKFRDGIPCNLHLHKQRMECSIMEIHKTILNTPLENLLKCPEGLHSGIVKCRVIYDTSIRSITWEPYKPRTIRTLRITEDNSIDYSHKYLDRRGFTKLLEGVTEDDILIVKDGYITDTSFANIIFRDGNLWVTPDTPLLRGTKRQELIDKGVITDKSIRVIDLPHFSEARIMNAMLGPMDHPPIAISDIRNRLAGHQ